jgi:hypothetical protein
VVGSTRRERRAILANVSRLLLGACAVLVVGCLDDPKPPDPVADCTSCAEDRCATYYDACIADADCSACFERPKSLECLADPLFQAAANCSCDECAGECSYLCPGGQGVCDGCSNSACQAEGDACLADTTCAPCLDDPFRPGCDSNPLYMAAEACTCESCGQECIWTCPAAGNMCASCISTNCSTEFSACLMDASCMDCFENPAREGCETQMTYGTLTTCLCAAGTCESLCDILFCTPP